MFIKNFNTKNEYYLHTVCTVKHWLFTNKEIVIEIINTPAGCVSLQNSWDSTMNPFSYRYKCFSSIFNQPVKIFFWYDMTKHFETVRKEKTDNKTMSINIQTFRWKVILFCEGLVSGGLFYDLISKLQPFDFSEVLVKKIDITFKHFLLMKT